jgi:[protein-PII] uridylyltransferase
VIHDHVTADVYPSANRSTGERLAIMAVGGYGRAEMAPHSDVDIAFLTPSKATAWCEQAIEAMLYFLWDLGLKVGHSTRSPEDVVRMGRADLTIRTALLEGRYVWGDRPLYDEIEGRFRAEVVRGTEREFVAAKLAERNARHQRVGDSRYVSSPTSRKAREACATSTRSTGSASTSTASAPPPSWSTSGCSPRPSTAPFAAPTTSSLRCAATST